MATSTYNLIASQVVGSGGASSITFSSIPGTYTDLKLVVSGRTNYAGDHDWLLLSLNNDTTSGHYSSKFVRGTGSSVTSGVGATNYFEIEMLCGNTNTVSTFSNLEVYIPNYTSSNQKSMSVDSVTENNGTIAYTDLIAGLWSQTSAITSIALTPENGTLFQQYSTFYLYGIKNS